MRVGLHLQLCHEFPSSMDPGSRHALEFSKIMSATPADLRKEPTNIYGQIAIPLKGGEVCELGLASLAMRLVLRVPLAPAKVAALSRRRKRSTQSVFGSFTRPSREAPGCSPHI